MLVTNDSMGAAAESFRQALRQARHPIALAGAGLSAASGIPTFRGAGGRYQMSTLAANRTVSLNHAKRLPLSLSLSLIRLDNSFIALSE